MNMTITNETAANAGTLTAAETKKQIGLQLTTNLWAVNPQGVTK